MSPVALIDMDGTLADYAGALKRDLDKLVAPEERPRLVGTLEEQEAFPHLKARMDLIKRTPDWWLNLEPIESGFRVVKMLRDLGYDLHILTKGPRTNLGAWTQKAVWCQRWIPDADITVTHDKGLVYGRVLVDDWPPYVQGWLEHRPRGLVIMPDQVWNQHFTHPQVIRLKQDGSTDAQVFEALADQRTPKDTYV
jgi:5'-nucleotidase